MERAWWANSAQRWRVLRCDIQTDSTVNGNRVFFFQHTIICSPNKEHQLGDIGGINIDSYQGNGKDTHVVRSFFAGTS